MKTKVIHAFLWILVCMVLGITCYQCRDLRGYVILSGSMEPVIPTGSVAVVDSSNDHFTVRCRKIAGNGQYGLLRGNKKCR